MSLPDFSLVRTVDEHLPYPDASFDCVLSYQTLEHVQNVGVVLSEILREETQVNLWINVGPRASARP